MINTSVEISIIDAAPCAPVFREALTFAMTGHTANDLFYQLPLWCCLAAGGSPEHGRVISAAFRLASTAASVLDDVQDADSDQALWREVGPAQATNSGLALCLSAQLALGKLATLGIDPAKVTSLQTSYVETVLQMCSGQHRDLVSEGDQVITLDECWEIMRTKTAVFFSWGCYAGALIGSDTNDANDAISAYATFGHHLGLLHQLWNDLRGLNEYAGKKDLAHCKKSLPLVYALSVARAETREQLQKACRAAPYNRNALHELRQLILQLGAVPYLLLMAETHYQAAMLALQKTGGQPKALANLTSLLSEFRLTTKWEHFS